MSERPAQYIVAVGSGKGGVDKSTVSLHIALALARRGVLCRLAQIVEERRWIGVAAIHLIPETRHFARLQIRCDERGLSRARWPGDPNDRVLAALVQERE